MRPTIVLSFGVLLNLIVAFVPVWLSKGENAWFRLEHITLAIGLTLLLLADAAGRSGAGPRATTAADERALRWARVTGLAILAFVWGALWERSVSAPSTALWQVACGGALMLAGAALRAAAIRRLGEQFVTEVTPEVGGRLVRSGIYASVRHPSESGLLLALAGIALVLGSPWATLVAIPIFVTLTWRRLRLEEQALRNTYGLAYGDYCRDVGALWPR